MFVEVHPDLARERGLASRRLGDDRDGARGDRGARARHRPRCGRCASTAASQHQVGLPYHWGSRGLTTGGSANDLTHMALDPNVHIQEVEGAHVRHPARAPAARRRALPEFVASCASARTRRGAARHEPTERVAREPPLARHVRRRGEAAHGLLHRHVGLHRLQGVRGRVQGVERHPRGRPRLDGRELRQHVDARRELVAARRVRRAAQAAAARTARPSTGERRRRAAALADVVATSASTARTPRASTSARPARSSAPSSAPSSCRRTSATAAATASRRARSACSTSAHLPRSAGRRAARAAAARRRRRTAASGSARSATTGSRAATSRRARRRARRTRSSSASSTSCASARTRGSTKLQAQRLERRAAVRPRSRRRRRRLRRVLPAARRAGGVRPAARPGRHDEATCRRCGRRRRSPRRRRSSATALAFLGGRGVSVTERGTEMRSYYGRPILKEPVWKPEIPFYFFTGGLAGGCSVLHGLARRRRARSGSRRRRSTSARSADVVSPRLLVSDLGRPERFLNMLRVFKVTSPMSVGSWVLVVSGGASNTAAALELLGMLRPVKWRGRGGVVRSPGRRSRPTRGRCSRTRRSRSGTRRGASCRGSSARARSAIGGRGDGAVPAAGARPARRGGSRSAASSASSA